MSIFRITIAAGFFAASAAQAAVVDFTDGIYGDANPFMSTGGAVPRKIIEEAGGVSFTVTPRFQDDVPQPFISSQGLTFGPQGNPLTGLSIVPDQDVVLTALEGIWLNPQFVIPFQPELIVPLPAGTPASPFGSPVLYDFPEFSTTLSEVTIFDGIYTLTAGSELFIDYFTDRPSDGRITRLFFDGATGGVDPVDPIDPDVSAVPLPASGLLLLFGLGGIAGLRRAKERQSA